MALSLLEEVKADSALYVQKSVGNWLNDAAKTQPFWVLDICSKWCQQSKGLSATASICKRALRSLDKVHGEA